MRIWRGTENAFPFLGRWPSVVRPDEVVPAMCSMPRRMRSSPCCTRNLPFPMRAAFGACSETLAVSFGVARNLPFPLQAAAQLLGNSRFFLFCYALCCAGLPRHPCAGANAAPAPAQGVSPLDPFPLARSMELSLHGAAFFLYRVCLFLAVCASVWYNSGWLTIPLQGVY